MLIWFVPAGVDRPPRVLAFQRTVPSQKGWMPSLLVMTRSSCHCPNTMTVRPPDRPSACNQLAQAIARWDNEGGASVSEPDEKNSDGALAQEEEHILQCLGAAVITQWNDLPTHIQRQLFQRAVSLGEQSHMTQLKEQIARFLHEHKDDAH